MLISLMPILFVLAIVLSPVTALVVLSVSWLYCYVTSVKTLRPDDALHKKFEHARETTQ